MLPATLGWWVPRHYDEWKSTGYHNLILRTHAELDLTDRHAVREIVEYKGSIVWDTAKPDGTPRKVLDVSRVHELGWRASTTLGDGIATAYKDFVLRNA